METQEIKWRLHTQKSRKERRRLLIGSTIVYAIALVAYFDDGNINPFFYFGSFLLFSTVILVLSGFIIKRKIYRQFKEIADEFELKQMDSIYEFNEDGVSYRDKEKSIELKWKVFTNYTTYKDFFILIVKDSYWQSYYFKDTNSDDNLNRIKSLVKSKLDFKKVE